MKEAGHAVICAREPGGTSLGEAVRELLGSTGAGGSMCREAELFLFLASRSQLASELIIPALREGTHVVCDRFADSTAAYQGYGRDCDMKTLLKMNEFAAQGIIPDVTILLDLDVGSGLERIETRNAGGGGKDRIECESLEFHERVRAGYLDMALRHPARIRRIDASRPVQEVREEIWRIVCRVIER